MSFLTGLRVFFLSQNKRSKFYGFNSIDVEVKSYLKLFIEEVLNPFYVFQILACVLWLIDEYYYYAICILVISLISMLVSLIETRRVSYFFLNFYFI
jgi:cation-transporting P-type ATPase 13A2